jgi:hypothetical protein
MIKNLITKKVMAWTVGIITSLVIGFVIQQQLEMNSKDSIIAGLQNRNTKLTLANESNLFSISQMVALHEECVDQFKEAKIKNDLAVKRLTKIIGKNDVRIKTIKERVYITDCPVDNRNIELLKEANNQN